MAGTLVVGADEVILRQDYNSYAASQPIFSGLELVNALSQRMAGRFVLLVNTDKYEEAAYWAKVNGLKGAHVEVLNATESLVNPEAGQWSQLERVRAQGPIWMMITAHPSVWKQCQDTLQPVLLFGRPGKPVIGPTRVAWNDIAESVRQSREANAEELISALEADR